MADYIASVDSGNGGNKLVLLDNRTGKTKTFYEASVRAMATGDSLGLKSGMEHSYKYIDWYGSRYVSGDDVVNVKRNVERHMGAKRYGEEFHRFLVATALAKAGVKDGTIDLILFAPPGLFAEAQKNIIKSFSGENAHVKIQLKGDKKPREFEYTSVTVVPEGIGVAACFMFDESGDLVGGDLFKGQVVILDPGAYTMDALRLVDGKFDPESLEHATWENAGVNAHVREPLLRQIHKLEGSDYKSVTIDDVDLMLRRGILQGHWTIEVAGYELNLETPAKNRFIKYADWIGNNICDGVFNSFLGVKSVIIASGGEVMIAHQLSANYPGKILERVKQPQAKNVMPVFMNAEGGLRYVLALAKQTQR